MKSWCIGTLSASYVARMGDVLAVYAHPYDPKCPLVSVNEVLRVLHATPRGGLPAQPGKPEREDYEWVRNCTANLFASIQPKTGRHRLRVTDRRTSTDFAEEVRRICDEDYPDAELVVLVCDNLNTHLPASLYQAFEPQQATRLCERIEWHYTPEHGSWLHVAECLISILSNQCVGRRVPERTTLESAVTDWQSSRGSVPIKWTFAADQARIKLHRLYRSTRVQCLP